MLQEYLKKSVGMNIFEEKCLTFQVVTKNDTWYVKNPEIEIESDRLPPVELEEAFRYLETKMGP
jgi:hypothetical protein